MLKGSFKAFTDEAAAAREAGTTSIQYVWQSRVWHYTGVLSSMRSRSWLIILIVFDLALWLGAILWPAWREETGPMSVVLGLTPGTETLMVAHAEEKLPERLVNLVEMTWTSAEVRAFQNGVTDAAVLSLGEVIYLREGGADVRVVLVMDASDGADGVVAKPGIHDLSDLRGKKVGMTSRASSLYVFMHTLEKAGMSLGDVVSVPINVIESEAAFDSGEVDAVVTSEPWLTRLVQRGGVNLGDSRGMPRDVYRVLAVRAERISLFTASLQALVNAHFQAREKLLHMTSKDPAWAMCAKREGVPPSKLRNVFNTIVFPDKEENRRLLQPDSGGLTETARKVSTYMLEHGLIKKEIDFQHFTDPTFVEKVP